MIKVLIQKNTLKIYMKHLKSRLTKGLLFCILLFTQISLIAQPWPRKSEHIRDNTKKMTDASVSLFNLHSDYEFPYVIPTKEDITEKLLRIHSHLEQSTMKELINTSTKEVISDYSKLPKSFQFGQGDYRPYTYEWGVTYSGMLKAAQSTGLKVFKEYVDIRLEILAKTIPSVLEYMKNEKEYKSPVNRVVKPSDLDDCGALCAASIRAKKLGAKYDLSYFIDNSLDFIQNKQFRLEDKTLARKRPYENTLWLDDLYMSIPALAEAYLQTKNDKYLNDAIMQLLNYSDRMFVTSSGLYMHSWVDKMEIHPTMHWGRANGWATLAMCDLLDVIPENHPQYKSVLALFKAHCHGLIKYQTKKGMWRQLIDHVESYEESSCTAMFVYGFAHGINKGWLDAKVFGPVALLGWNGLGEQINNIGQIENVCVGTGVGFDCAYYYYRHVHPFTAHGYGPTLMAGSEIIDLVKNFKIVQNTAIYFYDESKMN